MFTKKNAFVVWLLVGLTLGVYGLYMFHRLNRELAAALQLPQTPTLKWYSQLVPVWGVVGLHVTAKRVNRAADNIKVVSPTAVWLFWSWFFVGPYARLQAAINKAVDIRVASWVKAGTYNEAYARSVEIKGAEYAKPANWIPRSVDGNSHA